jgi:predicted ATPase
MRLPQDLLPRRYRQIAPLGEGTMGRVSRVYDRLNGQHVALKQVLLPADLPPDRIAGELLTLAHEFRVLAGLRHPHIISVLDYGFDSARRPFYTMELLPDARDILVAGRELPQADRPMLLREALEALAYLHRRGILHHDLKPSNILVSDGRLRLLDFGLAVLASQRRDDDAFGTLQYLAPEVLDGQPYTEASDLYSLGVIAYELLVGAHPFPAETVPEYIQQLFTSDPDLTPLADQPALMPLIGQLLAKAPADRPRSAEAALAQLRQGTGQIGAAGTQAIRESYLQAATFVGRAHELATLTDALAQAQQGRGSTWLVGGESGVGKSRLLEELRTLALVSGFQVLRGQAVQGGGLPYQLWREPLRRLILELPLRDDEAGVLHEIVPDIERLLAHPVTDAMRLANADQQERIQQTIFDLFLRLDQPTLLILEDLQWASESLIPLRLLQPVASQIPLCIISSYRSDERPTLLSELAPEIQQLPLHPLAKEGLVALTSAMLGAANISPQLVELLQRETEGNAFFVVETVRVLAEQAGDLEQVGQMEIPERVLGGGVLQVLQRRLAQMPDWGRPLLNHAATAGRLLDLALLAHLAPTIDLEHWLTTGSSAAIFEVYDGNWRFRHDKLREAVLAELLIGERQALHRQVAQALETLYGGLPAYTQVLYEQWRGGGEHARAAPYAAALAEQQLYSIPSAQVIAFAEEALALSGDLVDDASATRLWRAIGESYQDQGDLEATFAVLAKSIATAQRHGSPIYQARAMVALAWTYGRLNQIDEALAVIQEALQLAEIAQDHAVFTDILNALGLVYVEAGRYNPAQEALERGLVHARAINDVSRLIIITSNLAGLALYISDLATARTHLEASLAMVEASGNRRAAIAILSNLGLLELWRYDHQASKRFLEQALSLARRMGNRTYLANILANLGTCYAQEFAWAPARLYFDEGLAISRANMSPAIEGHMVWNMAWYWLEQRDLAEAQRWLDEAAAIAESHQINDLRGQIYHLQGVIDQIRGEAVLSEASFERGIGALVGGPINSLRARLLADRGLCRWSRGALEDAEADLVEALESERAIDTPRGEATCLLYLALVATAKGERGVANQRISEADTRLRDGESVIARTLLDVVRAYLAYRAGDHAQSATICTKPTIALRLSSLQQHCILDPMLQGLGA